MPFHAIPTYPPRHGQDERYWREPYSVFTNSDGRLMMVDPFKDTPVLIHDPTYDMIDYHLDQTVVGENYTAFVMRGPQGLKGYEVRHANVNVVFSINTEVEWNMIMAYAGNYLYTIRGGKLVCLNKHAPDVEMEGCEAYLNDDFRVKMVSLGATIFIWFQSCTFAVERSCHQFMFDGTRVEKVHGESHRWCRFYYSRLYDVVFANNWYDDGMQIVTFKKTDRWVCRSALYEIPNDFGCLTNTCFGVITHNFNNRRVSRFTLG